MTNKSVVTLLIEENAFVREGIKSLLEKSKYVPSMELSNLKDLGKNPEHYKSELVIFGTEVAPENINIAIKTIKSMNDHVKVVMLMDHLDRSSILAAFSAEADGYMLKNISAEAFLTSLELIMMHEKIFPTLMASILSECWSNNAHEHADVLAACHLDNCDLDNCDLSEREMDIIKRLAKGEPNKLIARNLSITESTVKVHLKTILRKLGLANRTQAALWAFSHGLTPSAISEKLCPDHRAEKSVEKKSA